MQPPAILALGTTALELYMSMVEACGTTIPYKLVVAYSQDITVIAGRV